jgi:hypothetical protein
VAVSDPEDLEPPYHLKMVKRTQLNQ